MNSLEPKLTWQKAPYNLDSTMGRTGHTCTVIGQYIFIIGGNTTLYATERNADVIVFDTENGTFKQLELTGNEPLFLYEHSACYWKDSKIIFYGGQARHRGGLFGKKASSQVGIITISNLEEGLESIKLRWEDVQTEQVCPRLCHTAHIYENKMYVFGGNNENATYLDLEDWIWKRNGQKGLVPKMAATLHTSILWGNQVYLYDLKSGSFNSQENKVFSAYDITTGTWRSLPLHSESDYLNAQFAAIQIYDNKIYLAKTSTEGLLSLKTFDLIKNQWSVLQTNHEDIPPRTHFSFSVCENKLVLYGGNPYSVPGNNRPPLAELLLLPLENNTQESIKKESKPLDKNTEIMKAFLAEAPYSDVTFEVERQLIPAHKWWLCNRSKYFANMFASGMAEANNSKIAVSDITANTFRGFLEFLYSDHIELDSILAEELLTQADKYSVPALKELCEEFLSHQLTPENYAKLANLSELVGADLLREAVKNYIAKNIRKLKQRNDFEQISTEMLRDVIVKVILK